MYLVFMTDTVEGKELWRNTSPHLCTLPCPTGSGLSCKKAANLIIIFSQCRHISIEGLPDRVRILPTGG